MTGWRRWTALLCVLGCLLSACTAGPSQRPEVAVNNVDEPSPTPTEPAREVPELAEMPGDFRWRPCSAEIRQRLAEQALPDWLRTECGRVNSVLDSPYAPGRGLARLQVLRAGEGPVPVVVVNDVGGLPGTIYAARLAATLPRQFFETFSLVGLDRRGTGNSAPVNCVPESIRRALVETDPTALPVAEWLEAAQTAGQQCSIALESHLPALDTWRTAADVDALRAALGQPQLNGIGHGEGSRVLSVFADRWPDRVGRLVLDGVPDPTRDAAIAQEGVAKGMAAAFDAFVTDCARRSCGLGVEPRRTLLELLGQLRVAPLTTPSGLDVTAGSALQAVRIGLSDRARWPELTDALARADQGDGSGIAAMLEPLVLGSDVQAASLDAEVVTTCNDTGTRLTPEQITRHGTDWQERFPTFGPLAARWLAVCGPWTVPDHPLPTPTAADAPPIVVIGTASDGVTPHEGSQRAAQQLKSGVFVSWQGAGHGALGFSPCATDAAVAFLTDAEVPRDGTVCPP